MGQIEWAMWANEQAVVSAVCMLMGGITGVAGYFVNWQFAAYAIPASVLILLLEWPRSKRQKGSTIERRGQIYLTKAVNKLAPCTSNYYVRFVLHLLLSIPCCFLLPTIMGAIALMIASIIYLVAAIKGEEWKPLGLEKKEKEGTSNTLPSVPPPTRPPPRAPGAPRRNENGQPMIEDNAV